MLNNSDIWISYHSRTGDGFFGLTSTKRPKEITITGDAFAGGIRVVAATIVHELAHVNGAPGAPSSMAEGSLNSCGFGDQFNPNAVGIQDDGRATCILNRRC